MLPLLNEAQATCLFFVTGASASDTPSMLWLEELYLMMLDSPTRLDLGALGMNSAKRQPQNKRALWVEAVKHLSRYGAPSRIAMLERIREQLGLPQSWSERYSHDSVSRERFFVLGAEGIRDLVSAGMSIGAHTLSHPMLSQQSLSGATTEITESKANLEAMLGKPIWSFAYPFGSPDSVTQRELDIVKRAGYRCAFMNVGGGFGAKTSPLAFPRMHVTSDMTLPEFEAHLTGLYRLLRERLGRDSTELRADPAQTGRALCAS
jgi:peptidoglycan/xylan/chitin deacetylase (PgdA/CDA1 family)